MPTVPSNTTNEDMKDNIEDNLIGYYVKKLQIYDEDKSKIYSIVTGWFTKYTKAKLYGTQRFSDVNDTSIFVELVEIIRNIAF